MATPVARPAKVVQRALSLDREADAWLTVAAPTKKAHGRYVSKLLCEDRARVETRAECDAAFAEILKLYGLPQKHHEVALEK